MAAVTVTVSNNDNVAGNRRQVFGTLKFPGVADGGYLTGGNEIDPFFFGLSVLDRLECELGRLDSDGSAAFEARLSTALPLKGNPDTPQGLLQAYWSGSGTDTVFDEVANTTDLSGYTVAFVATGV